MVEQLEVEVEVAAAAGAGLEVALALEPQAAAGFHPGRNPHLHPLLIDGQGALAAPKGIGKTEADAGLGIEVEGRPAGACRTTGEAPGKAAAGEAGGEAKPARGATKTAASGPAATAKTAQQVVDEVVEVAVAAEINIAAAAGPASLVPVLAELFVAAALIGIGEHLVGLADLLELRLRLLVIGIDIRVVLAGQLAEGPLHRIGVGAPLQAQHLEVIAISTGSHRGVGGERSMAPPLSQLKRPRWGAAMGGRPNALALGEHPQPPWPL